MYLRALYDALLGLVECLFVYFSGKYNAFGNVDWFFSKFTPFAVLYYGLYFL